MTVLGADGLQVANRGPPSAFVVIDHNGTTYRTRTCPPSASPRWDEDFYLSLGRQSSLTIALCDAASACRIAEVTMTGKDVYQLANQRPTGLNLNLRRNGEPVGTLHLQLGTLQEARPAVGALVYGPRRAIVPVARPVRCAPPLQSSWDPGPLVLETYPVPTGLTMEASPPPPSVHP